MPTFRVNLKEITVINKGEVSKAEPYLWVFGVLIDLNTIAKQKFVVKQKVGFGNLGKGFKKGETRKIPNDVGLIERTVAGVPLDEHGREKAISGGVIVLAWEHDQSKNADIKSAYADSVEVLNDYVTLKILKGDYGYPSADSITKIQKLIKGLVVAEFVESVRLLKPKTWDQDDFVNAAASFDTFDLSDDAVQKKDILQFVVASRNKKDQVISKYKITGAMTTLLN